MVNTLSGSVCAYRKETVKPRFIRIDEVMALLDVTQDEAMDIALAAGARYQLAKIILVHKERLMKFMKHSARVPSSNKIVEKKFVRIGEGSMTYSIGHTMATYCKYFLSCVFEAVTMALRFVTNTASGMGLIKCGSVVIPFDNQISKDTDLYRLYNTNIHEKIAEQKKKEAMLQ